MRLRFTSLAVLAFVLAAKGQTAPPGPSGVSLGHFHFHTADPDAQARFWVDVLGATPTRAGSLEIYKLPGVFIAITKATPAGGTDGSVVNHVGLRVRDLSAIVAKAKAAQVALLSQSDTRAMLLAPDNIRVELTADPSLSEQVASDHIHFYGNDPARMSRWYVETFGALPGKQVAPQSASLPGIELIFTSSTEPKRATKDRALDHVGFEVSGLRHFTRKLGEKGQKVDLPYLFLPDLGIAIGFVTDPWGTTIELTEGLNKL